jgi:MFS family permease
MEMRSVSGDAVPPAFGAGMAAPVEQVAMAPVPRRAWYALFVLVVVFSLNFMDRTIANVLIDPIKAELHLSDMAMGLIVGFGFTVLYALLGIPVGRLSDRGNRRNIITIGLLIWSAFTGLSGCATGVISLAVTRIGVGVGESCGWAPSVSMVTDYFPSGSRAKAVGILGTSSTIGAALGLLIGGVVGHHFGWRVAFFVAGIPGLLMVLVLRFTVVEPLHGGSEAAGANTRHYSMREVMTFLCAQHSALAIITGSIALGFAAYTYGTWVPSLLRRVHHLPGDQIGLWLGAIHLLAGTLGAVAGGHLTDVAARRDRRWLAGVPALMFMLYVPTVLLITLPDSLKLCLTGVALQTFLTAALYGPCWSLIQSVVRVRMRAVTLSISLALNTLIGFGLGAPLIGAANDALLPRFGVQAIRYSLLAPAVFLVVGAVLFACAARHVPRDIDHALADD